MYHDHFRHTLLRIAILVVTAGLAFGAWTLVRKRQIGMQENVSDSLRQSILDMALQCYVIEGAYPRDLSYLEDNYGLIVNHRDYAVIYEVFAENLPPEVRVGKK